MSAEQADIFQLVEGRRRRRKNTKGESTPKTPLNNPASGDACAPSPKPPQKTSPLVSKWTPKPTVRMDPDDYVIVLKPRITVALKTAFQQELTPVREYKKTVPACHRCGTRGHRSDICPNPVKERCGLCGQNGGADTEEMVPHECNPMCIVCGGPHLTSSRGCTGKFIKLQQPGPRTSGSPTKPKRQPTGKAPTPGKIATETLPPGAAESPALSAPSGGAARDQDKVGSRAEIASSHSPPSSSPTSTAETQELRRELALLRAQNEKLASELHSLRTHPITPPSSSEEEENITDREIPTTVESRVVALKTQVTAIETQLADLPQIIHDTIARQVESVITEVTEAVTHIIQKWIQDNPRVLKRVGHITDVNRPSKFNRVTPDESDFTEDSGTSAPGASRLGSLNNATPPSVSDHGPQP
ncbi:hypothetical protein HPB52_006383 [Rhipicephalus sanguineus]|uniref:CCHC-type domain-containing protein n=1 Tax=Rhipicephalus sanguineus TaxID=34632 RepID=A0A9D4T2S7_RHISA|nr:hypothetical protein HPB52_006383 [Rhipicephalus sanguineus]